MIGIFDSGVGGFTVLKATQEELPDLKIAYLADLANLPYGNKSAKAIQKISQRNAHFLVEKGAKIIVIACNTASAYAYDTLKKKFDIPILDVISPAVEAAKKATKNKRIGVIGTLGTINSGVYQEKLADYQIFAQACPLLVPLIEEGWQEKPETKKILKKYLRPLKNQGIDTLILGCTHYPLLQNQIQKIMGKNIKIINSADTVAQKLAEIIKSKKIILDKGEPEIHLTDLSQNFQDNARRFLGIIPKIKKVDL
jgi:glutamate racemase